MVRRACDRGGPKPPGVPALFRILVRWGGLQGTSRLLAAFWDSFSPIPNWVKDCYRHAAGEERTDNPTGIWLKTDSMLHRGRAQVKDFRGCIPPEPWVESRGPATHRTAFPKQGNNLRMRRLVPAIMRTDSSPNPGPFVDRRLGISNCHYRRKLVEFMFVTPPQNPIQPTVEGQEFQAKALRQTHQNSPEIPHTTATPIYEN